MVDHLIFQLYGPMAAWGEPAVGQNRHSGLFPSKSALTGLLAAALGIKREDEAQQQQLCNSVQFGLKVLSVGTVLRDFHTSQVPGQSRKRQYYTREQEINTAPDLNTILSSRDYRCDAHVLVAVKLTAAATVSLEQLKAALLTPHFQLYLGRKSCPLAIPLAPAIVCLADPAQGLKAALGLYQPQGVSFAGPSSNPNSVDSWLVSGEPFYVWEGDAVDMQPSQTRVRQDLPISRGRWQFGSRQEHLYYGESR